MRAIRLIPEKSEENYRLTLSIDDVPVDDVLVEGRSDRARVGLRGPGAEVVLALSLRECQIAGFDLVEAWFQLEGLSWPFTWNVRQEWLPDDPNEPVSFDRKVHFAGYAHSAELELEPSRWKGPWSIAELATAMQQAALGMEPAATITHPEHEDGVQNLIFVELPLVVDMSTRLSDLLALCERYLPDLEAAARDALSQLDDGSAVIQRFRFSPAVSAACQQYLVYFVQFLSDLGIEADAELRSSTSEVLFRITPRDGKEALARVREALDAYLAASTAIVLAEAPDDADPAIVQLMSNVDHLRGQLRIARTEADLCRDQLYARQAQLDARQAQLDAKDLSIQLLRAGIGSPAIQVSQSAPEPLLDGLITLGKVEKGGVSFDLGLLLRKLRRRPSR